MSGIAGIVGLTGASDLTRGPALQKMLLTMDYRGPDGRHETRSPDCAFGFLSLVSTPYCGVQPLALSGHLITADARLDEREKLAGKLGVSPVTCDAELILGAYLRWGNACVEHISGDFAFAIRSPAGVFCARDHLGVKPFYYSEFGGCFLFASEARAIRAVTRAAISQHRIADSLYPMLEHIDKTSTPYEGVFRLPPATTLTVIPGSVVTSSYWLPEAVEFGVKQTDQDYIDAFRAQLDVAVSQRVSSQGSTAITLSGGVDSTTLIGIALSAGHAVRSFSTVSGPAVETDRLSSAGMAGSNADFVCIESQFIHLAAGSMPVDSVLLGPDEMASMIEAVFSQLGRMQEPFDYAMIQLMLLNMAAVAAGHTSLIDGVEGDMLYSLGSGYPALLYREGHIIRGVSEALLAAKVRGHAGYTRALWTSIRQLGAPGFMARIKRQLTGNPIERDLRESLLNEDFLRETGTLERLEQHLEQMYAGIRTNREAHFREITHPALPAALERYDRVAALSGIEPRHPLIDRRLVELSLGLPAHLKVRHGWTKYVLRKASEGTIPQAITWRTDKSENAWRLDEILHEHKQQSMRDFITGNSILLQDYIKPEKLKSLDEDDLPQLFGLAKWLQGEHDLVAG